MNFSDIKDTLLQDLSISRNQIRASEEWHNKISIVFTLSIITASVTVYSLSTLNQEIRLILLCIINLIILSQLSFLLNYHVFYIKLWAGYVELIEDKLKLLYRYGNIIEFENNFSPIYFYQKGKIPTISPNKVLIILMHLPSFILYWINIIFIFYPLIVIIKENYLFNNLDRTSFFSLAFRGSIILFFLLVLALLFIKYYVSYTKMLINQIKAQKKDSIQEFIKWLKKIKK